MIQGVLAFSEGRMPETRIDQQRAAVEHCAVLAPAGSVRFDLCVANVTGRLHVP
jgi:hypothetical protein